MIGRRAARLPAAALRSDRGVGIVEVLAALLLIAIGLIAMLGAFSSTEREASTATKQSAAIAVGENELERLRDLPFNQLALTSLPAVSGDGLQPGDDNANNPRNPNFYVTGSSFQTLKTYGDKTSGPLRPQSGETVTQEPFVAVSPSGVAPSSRVKVDSSTNNATLYRYITWRDETCAPQLPAGLSALVNTVAGRLNSGLLGTLVGTAAGTLFGTAPSAKINLFCADTRDAKRVTVAVVLDRPGGGSTGRARPDRPVWLSTLVRDPNKGLISY